MMFLNLVRNRSCNKGTFVASFFFVFVDIFSFGGGMIQGLNPFVIAIIMIFIK